jgi:hypothetical protein
LKKSTALVNLKGILAQTATIENRWENFELVIGEYGNSL